MANQEEHERLYEGKTPDDSGFDGKPDSGDAADRAQGTDPEAEVQRQIDTGEENVA